MSRQAHIITWFLGLAVLAAVVWYFQPDDFVVSLRKVGYAGAGAWLMVTFVARMLYAEVPTRLLKKLGYPVDRAQIFSIAWLRTFSNQLVPMTGIAVYIQQIRSKLGASWQDLAASSSQQIFIGVAALGITGVLAVTANIRVTGDMTLPLVGVFVALASIALASALGVSAVIKFLPGFLQKRIGNAAESFDKVASNPGFVILLVCIHVSAILLRGARVWLLFAALGVTLQWQEALLIVALAEATVLIAVTPGGLGIREAIIIGGATILGIPTDAAVAVSLIDRLFVVVLTAAMAAPSAWYLFRTPTRRTEPQ